MTTPALPKIPGTYQAAGQDILDPYFGLRLLAGAALDEVVSSEKTYLAEQAEAWKAAAERIKSRARTLLEVDHKSYPHKYRGVTLYTLSPASAEHEIHYLVDSAGNERVLLDGNERAKGASAWELGSLDITKDGQTLLISECRDGSEKYNIVLIDKNGNETQGPTEVGGGAELTADGRVIHTLLDPLMRTAAIAIWNPSSGETTEIIRENQDDLYLGFFITEDEKHLVITAQGHDGGWCEIWTLQDGQHPEPAYKSPRIPGGNIEGAAYGETAVFLVDEKDGASYILDARDGKELIPARDGIQICAVETDGVNLYLDIRSDEGLGVEIWDGENKLTVTLEGGGDLAVEDVLPGEDKILVTQTGWGHPERTWEVCPIDGRSLLVHTDALGPADLDAFTATRLEVTARDGEKVPATLIQRKEDGGPLPVVAYAYGAYGSSLDAWFSASRIALMEEGIGFLVIHARGGGEKGRRWHEGARLGAKTVTFTDIEDVIEELRRNKEIGKVVLCGGSAGGAAVAAVANLNPEGLSGVIAQVPFVDALATMCDETLPLTAGEYVEWGDPRTPEGCGYIKAWSPVDNIQQGAHYPPYYISVGLNDPRVGFWEGLKLAARLRAENPQNQVVVRIDADGGHQGVSGKWDFLNHQADEWGFAARMLNEK